jgi:hypothetical protein
MALLGAVADVGTVQATASNSSAAAPAAARAIRAPAVFWSLRSGLMAHSRQCGLTWSATGPNRSLQRRLGFSAGTDQDPLKVRRNIPFIL